MPEDRPDIAALLGSRICHDLISPLGAIGNGVELLMMSGAGSGPEIALISESVTNANARIRFFRVAFGAAGSDQRMGRAEIVSILSDMTRGGRVQIDWQAPGDQPRRDVKLAFLMLQCLETAMPYGGRVTIAREALRWTIRGSAAKLKLDPPLWAALSAHQAGAGLTAAQVQFGLIPEELARQSRRMELKLAETEITFTFR